MSSEPHQRKSPEELAALRAEKFSLEGRKKNTIESLLRRVLSLKSAKKPASADLPDHLPSQEFESSESSPQQEESSLPKQLLRAEPEPVAKKTVLPPRRQRAHPPAETSAFVEEPPPIKKGIPERRRSEQEIQQLRHRGFLQTRPPVQSIIAMELHPFLTGLIYLWAGAAVFLSLRYWSSEGTTRFYAPGIGCLVLLLISWYLFRKKPRAHHHAAFLIAIALLILGFVILFTLKNPYAA